MTHIFWYYIDFSVFRVAKPKPLIICINWMSKNYLRRATCAAMTLCLSTTRRQLAHLHSLHLQRRLWPLSPEMTPWFLHRAHFGVRNTPILLFKSWDMLGKKIKSTPLIFAIKKCINKIISFCATYFDPVEWNLLRAPSIIWEHIHLQHFALDETKSQSELTAGPLKSIPHLH